MKKCKLLCASVLLATTFHCAGSSVPIVDFIATNVSLGGSVYVEPGRKPFVSTNEPTNAIIRYDFTTVSSQPLFAVGGRPLCYGGMLATSTNVPKSFSGLVRFNNPAAAKTVAPGLTVTAASHQDPGEKQGYPHAVTFLALWIKEQFLGEAAKSKVQFAEDSRLQFHTSELTTGEVRFVVRNADAYYASEFVLKTNGISRAQYGRPPLTVTLTGFNKNNAPGSRWMKFTPTATDFNLPTPLPPCEAVDFNDVREVGFLLLGGRPAYLGTYSCDEFGATAVVSPK